MNGTRIREMEHGIRRMYQCGCRCAPCTAANATYQRHYRAYDRTAETADGKRVRWREVPIPGLRVPVQ